MIGGQKWSVILEMLWLVCHNPEIDQKTGKVKIIMCLEECGKQWRLKQGKLEWEKQKEEKKKEEKRKRQEEKKQRKKGERKKKGKNNRSKKVSRGVGDLR